jgi:hypothetical protein
LNAEAAAPAPAPRPVVRPGGLLPVAAGRVHPCFALFCAFMTLDVALLLYVPYFAARFTDSPWSAADRMGFLGKAIASGLAFGLVASISAERRNRSPWWFIAGHLGVFVAAAAAFSGFDRSSPFAATLAVVSAGFLGSVVALFATQRPADLPPKADPALSAIMRLMYAVSNVKFGIVLMAIVAVAVQYGSIHENRYNSKSAHFEVYRSWWFGSTWFLAGLSMLAATFRKWPWRFEQSGWLTVHSGLALTVVGSMISFFSSAEGELALREGQTGDSAELRNASRLVIEEAGLDANRKPFRKKALDVPTAFDADPVETQPRQRFTAELGADAPGGAKATMTVDVDRYYYTAALVRSWTDDGPEPRAGVEFDLTMRGGGAESVRLDERDESSYDVPFGGGSFSLQFARLTKPLYEAVLRTTDPVGFGKVVIKDRTGAVAAELPVAPESRPTGADDGTAAKLAGSAVVGDATVELAAYADNGGPHPSTGAFSDMSPGLVRNPAISLTFKRGDKSESRIAYAFKPPAQEDLERAKAGDFPFVASYEFAPRLKIEGPVLVFTPAEGGQKWAYVSRDGTATGGDVKVGEPLGLPIPMLTIVPRKIFERVRTEESYKFEGYRDNGLPEAARATVRVGDAQPTTVWLRRGGPPAMIPAGDRVVGVSWRAGETPLGFSLKLNDFHRDFYPGSASERVFESYLELEHPTKFPQPTDVKIDMNRPLRLDGWRLYQSRFGRDDATTFLQVNRDPGLAVIYPACCVVLLGLVVVSFMKKAMRERRSKLEAAGASATRHVVEAFGTILLAGLGPLLFGLWVYAGLPLSGGLGFLFGLLAVVVAPSLFVVYYVRKFGPARPTIRTEHVA